jgi:hypothetical protein
MKKLLVCIGLAALAVVVAPAPAHANISWWDFIEELSGPGPFFKRGPLGVFAVDTAVACRVAAPPDGGQTAARPADGGSGWIFVNSADCALDPTRRGPRRVTDFFLVRVGATATESNRPLFSDRPGELQGKVTAWTIDTRFTRRLDASIELAAGAGIIFFTGDTIDHRIVRPTVTPLSVVFTPIGLAHRTNPQKYDGLFGLRFEQMAVLGGLKATDFNSTSRSSFTSDNIDLIRRFSVTVDISPFVFPRSR